MSDNEAAAPDPSNQLEEFNTNQDSANPSFDESDSLLRLMVGGTLEGSDELRRRLQEWEQELADMDNEPIEADDIQSMTQYVRIAFVGFLFSTKWQIDRAVPRLLRVADVYDEPRKLALRQSLWFHA